MSDSKVSTLISYGDSPVLVFADHASNRIPESLNGLGVPDDILQTHIAWDIGARALTQDIAEQLSATALLCDFSRLVIDANRDLSSGESIPAVSDQIPVPGNQMLSERDRAQRIKLYFDPYHAALDKQMESQRATFIVSIHSFTKRMMGAVEDRPWHVGMLWRDDEASAKAIIEWLRKHTDWQVGDNQPYDARLFNYTIDRHVGARGIAHLTFEVRQDLLTSEQQIKNTGELISRGIEHVINTRNN